jgi:hypothetical protein
MPTAGKLLSSAPETTRVSRECRSLKIDRIQPAMNRDIDSPSVVLRYSTIVAGRLQLTDTVFRIGNFALNTSACKRNVTKAAI